MIVLVMLTIVAAVVALWAAQSKALAPRRVMPPSRERERR